MLEKLNNQNTPKEVLNNILELYHKRKFEEILKQENEYILVQLISIIFLDQQT